MLLNDFRMFLSDMKFQLRVSIVAFVTICAGKRSILNIFINWWDYLLPISSVSSWVIFEVPLCSKSLIAIGTKKFSDVQMHHLVSFETSRIYESFTAVITHIGLLSQLMIVIYMAIKLNSFGEILITVIKWTLQCAI